MAGRNSTRGNNLINLRYSAASSVSSEGSSPQEDQDAAFFDEDEHQEEKTYVDEITKQEFQVSDSTLVQMTVRDLNHSLRNQPNSIVKQVKDRRRLLKNRGYAQNTREKVLELNEDYGWRKERLSQEVRNLKKTNANLQQDLRDLRSKRKFLEEQVLKNKKSNKRVKK